ncbi:RNA-directed DNA polymerase from mobile element jockey, partial [Paramuricea clavata]
AVKINEFRSEWAYVNGGVPQGKKLGPILFLVMINDLKMKSLNSFHWKYVDDVTISEVIKETEESRLQTELNELQQWACENDMKLNGLKCKEMVVSFLRQSDNYTPLHINDQQLELVTSFKILGLTINNHLKWNDNVAIIVKKASKRLYILRVLRRSGIPPADLLSIYNALIRSVLEYACAVWHTSLPQYLSNKIERVQKRALRILYPFTDYAEALSISRCSRLDDRRQSICQNTLQKIANPCSKLYHLLPSTRGNVHGRSLRNNNQLSLPKCRTERFKNSFIPAMCYSQVDV